MYLQEKGAILRSVDVGAPLSSECRSLVLSIMSQYASVAVLQFCAAIRSTSRRDIRQFLQIALFCHEARQQQTGILSFRKQAIAPISFS